MMKTDLLIKIIAIIVALISSTFFLLRIFNQNMLTDQIIVVVLGISGAILGTVISTIILRFKTRRKIPSIFIAYHHFDREVTFKIARELKKISNKVWLDEYEIHAGDSISDKIYKGIKESDYCVLILSETSVKSKWVEAELLQVKKLGKKLLPVRIDSTEPPDNIKNIAYADLSKSFEDGIQSLKKVFIKAAHS